MRDGLIVRPLFFRGDRYWGVKDPIALRYFQLRDEEYFILRSLNGRASAAEIKTRFEEEFAPRKLDLGQLNEFLGLLHQQGLILSDAPDQGQPLLVRRKRERRRATISALGNILAVRLPGVDPERFLNWLYPKCRWLFSPASVVVWFLLVLSSLLLLAVQFDVLQARLPEFQEFLTARNVVWLAVVLAFTKVLHELAHGLACKHYGGECHEIGLMFLVFTPCLYCNVSDAWMLPSKWRRAAIGAAGMYVEIGLASLCAFLWWFTEPGFANSIFLNVMFVCSVSTLVFNGNPLLRFDGYFILADLVEVPNLQQRSRAVVLEFLRKRVLGVERGGIQVVGERHPGWLALYWALSTSYRLVVVVAILWFCHQVLTPHRLGVVAQILTLVVVCGLLVGPTGRFLMFLRDPRIRRQVRWLRLACWSGLAALSITGILLIPLPYRITAPAVLEPSEAKRVYVSVPGTLEESVNVGEHVVADQTLVRLDNLEIKREIAELVGTRDLRQLHLTNLQGRRISDPSVGEQIPVAEEVLADVEKRLQQRQQDYERLVLKAPCAGTVLPAPWRERPSREVSHTWLGNPLDERNRGAYLETGTLLCLIGNPTLLHATLVVDQADIALVKNGQRVRVQLDQLPGSYLEGTVTELAELDLKNAPRELLAAGLLPTREGPHGQRRPIHASYLARVVLEDVQHPLLMRASGRAKIYVAPQSLGFRIYRYLRRTVRFP
jgi:putative peptide zinc metalloprotease protein